MTRTFGVEWEARDMGRDRNPAWAISSVPEELVREFSTRARYIDAEKDRLIAEYVARHGRQPSTATIIASAPKPPSPHARRRRCGRWLT